MKKYIVLSVNDNPEYMFYLPLTVWAWRQFGWEPVIFLHDNESIEVNPIIELALSYIPDAPYSYPGLLSQLREIEGYGSDTIAQISRLYAACVQDGYLMTGDVDMIPLSDYWKVDQSNELKITTWGHDLTSYQHFPICYIGMNSMAWRAVMGVSSNDYNAFIKRDLDYMPNARSEDSVKRWVVDQDLITERLNSTQFEKVSIHRGVYQNGYPIGRVDRSAWTLDHPQLIDCHMLRGIWKDPRHMRMTMDLLQKVWPNEDFGWFEEYTSKFKQTSQWIT